MAAGQPHGVTAPASSASISSESESDSYRLVDLDFFILGPGFRLE